MKKPLLNKAAFELTGPKLIQIVTLSAYEPCIIEQVCHTSLFHLSTKAKGRFVDQVTVFGCQGNHCANHDSLQKKKASPC